MPHSQQTPRRWEVWTSSQQHRRLRRCRSETLGLLTPDRIGDHLVTRCMALKEFHSPNLTNWWLPEALGGPRMNFGSRRVLGGIVNAVNDEIEAIMTYENESNVLVQLAQTGYIAEQISKLNRLLDVALAAYGIPESRGMATWHAVFQQERQERMARFQIMVANKKLLMQILGDEQQQLEVLTLLAYDFQKHGEDTYTDLEYDVISDVYQTCLRLSGLAVVAVPEWFVPAYEIEQSRWQGIGVDVEYLLNQNEEFCTRQASALWDLHHPHVVKLFGACHVGGSLFLVHESVKKSVSSRDAQLETAHILQSLPNENKVMLHGGELLLSPVISLRVNLKKQQLTTSPLLTSFLKHAE